MADIFTGFLQNRGQECILRADLVISVTETVTIFGQPKLTLILRSHVYLDFLYLFTLPQVDSHATSRCLMQVGLEGVSQVHEVGIVVRDRLRVIHGGNFEVPFVFLFRHDGIEVLVLKTLLFHDVSLFVHSSLVLELL